MNQQFTTAPRAAHGYGKHPDPHDHAGLCTQLGVDPSTVRATARL
jgi:hypothetical protein